MFSVRNHVFMIHVTCAKFILKGGFISDLCSFKYAMYDLTKIARISVTFRLSVQTFECPRIK